MIHRQIGQSARCFFLLQWRAAKAFASRRIAFATCIRILYEDDYEDQT